MKHLTFFRRVRVGTVAPVALNWTAAADNAIGMLADHGLLAAREGDRVLVRRALDGVLVFSTAEPRHLELWADGVAMGAQCQIEAARGQVWQPATEQDHFIP